MASLLADQRSGYRCIYSDRMELKKLLTRHAPGALPSSAERRRTQSVDCRLIAQIHCGAQSTAGRERPVTEEQPLRRPLGRSAHSCTTRTFRHVRCLTPIEVKADATWTCPIDANDLLRNFPVTPRERLNYTRQQVSPGLSAMRRAVWTRFRQQVLRPWPADQTTPAHWWQTS